MKGSKNFYGWKGLKLFIVALPIMLIIILAGCSSKHITLDVKHTPLYMSTNHKSTIHAEVESSDGVKRIEIKITKGKLVDRLKLSDPPSVIPLRKDAVTFTKIFNYSTKPKAVAAKYTEDFGNQALVSYQVKAISWKNEVAESQEITFAAGPPKAAGYAYSATDVRPVCWHRQAKMDTKIDMCFYPDKDYKGVYSLFTSDMRKIIDYAYFDKSKSNTIVTVYGRNWRFFWNLWAAPFGADKDAMGSLSKKPVSTIQAVMDGGAIVHATNMNYRDWGTCSLGGHGAVTAPSAFGATPDVMNSARIFVHESGHFLHGFGDEYCCDGGYFTKTAQYPNLFTSEAACKAAAKKHNFDAKKCSQIGTKSIWHLNQADEIMGNTLKYGYGKYKFFHFCDLSVKYRYAQCTKGKCY